MKPKRHYIPIVPDKPKQGPKITRLFSWKKHYAEKEQPKVEEEQKVEKPEKPAGGLVWKIIKTVALVYAIVGFIAFIVIFISINQGNEEYNSNDDSYWKAATQNTRNTANDGSTRQQTIVNTRNTPIKQSSGLCSTDADCAGFGARNGGPAICGSDRLCHICYSLRGQTCVSCSRGCDVNTYCEKSVCVFRMGGKTTD